MVDVADEALVALADRGPEYDPFHRGFSFSNHGPMVVDALLAMGRDDEVIPWLERYLPRLSGQPERRERITADWNEALGDLSRVRDWVDVFDDQLADTPWEEVLNQWIPRLAPGTYGGVHGSIRTAHAVRMLDRGESAPRIGELAQGLGYWAATYETLPRSSASSAGLLPSEALRHLEQLDEEDRKGWILFTDPIGKLASLPSFGEAADLVDTGQNPSYLLSDLTRAFAAILLTNNESVNPRALCHGLTAGGATRLMLDHLSPEATASSLLYNWQLTAAFYCALVLELPAQKVDLPQEGADELISEALQCPDEHGIKVTEACLREYQFNPDPMFLVSARETTRRLNVVGLNLY